MKNIFKLIGITALAAVIGFTAASCDLFAPAPETPEIETQVDDTNNSGTFTLTGISEEHKNLYVRLEGTSDNVKLLGYKSIDTEKITLSSITNGSVTIPVWDYGNPESPKTNNIARYSGSGTFEIKVGIFDSETKAIDSLFNIDDATLSLVFKGVKFNAGIVTKTWSDKEEEDDDGEGNEGTNGNEDGDDEDDEDENDEDDDDEDDEDDEEDDEVEEEVEE
jgi:hypothetical protein